MAPIVPSEKRPSARELRHQRITGQIHPLLPSKVFRPNAAVSDDFLSSKRDKRLMKHSSFVSRVVSSSSSRVGKTKRRRPANKLKTTLEGLADALPDLVEGDGEAELSGKVRHRSLKSRKGALKRKERVVKGEMERFGVSMAKLAGTGVVAPKSVPSAAAAGVNQGLDEDGDEDDMDDADDERPAAKPASTTTTTIATTPAAATTSNRWAALRGYISATMEQNPAFTGKK